VPSPAFRTVEWAPSGALRIIDQRRLPAECVTRDLASIADVADAIRTLAVRGAPAIGVAAAMGLAASAAAELARGAWADAASARLFIEAGAASLRGTRPTAVNLMWALDRMLATLARTRGSASELVTALRNEAEAIRAEDEAMCEALGAHGRSLLKDGMRVLTHCNAGALATAGIGTALAPVYVAKREGLSIAVFANETRPLLQGARLTAWELGQAGVPVTILTDGMAASLMAAGEIDIVFVGADRIAANGDVANKIGTYALAVLAKHHRIPFIVVAPSTTIDAQLSDGQMIPIEQRDASEVTHLGGARVAAEGARVLNPAFDVTPAALISHLVTEDGVLCAPYHFDHAPIVLPPA
jgi:methylthioribose-1-phosphate isomerase